MKPSSALAARASRALREGRVAKAIVGSAFVGIAQDIVSLSELLEFLLRRVIARIFVRVKFHRQFAVGAFELLPVGRALHFQDFVVVAFRGH